VLHPEAGPAIVCEGKPAGPNKRRRPQ